MAATEKRKTVSLALDAEDVDALRSAVRYMLDHEEKLFKHQPKRARLYRLDRRLNRARLELEK